MKASERRVGRVRLPTRRRIVATGLLVLAGPAAGSAVASPDPFEAGTVVTLSGPAACPETAAPDRTSLQVRALSVDGAGRLWFDTGLPGRGEVARVGLDGQAGLVQTGERAALAPAGALAPDGAGGVFLAAGDRLIQVRESGAPTLVMGRVGAGYAGPEGAEPLRAVRSLASADDGNVFVAEEAAPGTTGTRIRFLNRGSDPVTFYARTPWEMTVPPGGAAVVAGGDGPAGPEAVPALPARIDGDPVVLAVTGRRLYVATHLRPPEGGRATTSVRLLNLGGEVGVSHGVTVAPAMSVLVAGGGRPGFDGDGGAARSARFSVIRGMAATPAGALYLVDEENHRVRRIDAAGTVTSVAGRGPTGANAGGYDGNGQLAVRARLDRPFGVGVGPGGAVYIADRYNHQVRYVDPAGVIRAAPGAGVGVAWNCGPGRPPATVGPPGSLPASQPVAVTVAGDTVWFLDARAGRLSHIDTSGRVVPGEPVRPSAPGCDLAGACPALAAGPPGVLYVREALDGAVTVLNVGPVAVEAHGLTLAPGERRTLLDAGGPGPLASGPGGVLYVGDRFGATVRRVGADGAVTKVVEGPGRQGVCCLQPAGLATDAAGNLYISDAFLGGRIWLLNLGAGDLERHGVRIPPGGSGAVAATDALERGFEGDGGPALEARFRIPTAVAAGAGGSLYIVDAGENTVRAVDAAGEITTAAGTGTFGFNGDHLNGPLTVLSSPAAIATDPCGNLLIADAGNGRVRRLVAGGPCGPAVPAASAPGGTSLAGRGRLLLVAVAAALVAGGAVLARRAGSRR